MNPFAQDKLIAREIVKEAMQGNNDAKHFLSQSQRALILIALYETTADRILKASNNFALKGMIELSVDGKMVANRLKANAKVLRFSIVEAIRDTWSTKGETPTPETDGVLQAKEIISSPFRLRSSKTDLHDFFGPDSRFFLGQSGDDVFEKKVLYQAKNNIPLVIDVIPSSILGYYGMEGSKPNASFFLKFFTQRYLANV